MKLAFFGTSNKENEQRVPVYPEHLERIPEPLRRRCWFEEGYGCHFGIDDDYFRHLTAGVVPRKQLFDICDMLVLPKPTLQDMFSMQEGQTLCGWVHCVQQTDIAQIAIDRKLTILAWEAMHSWSPSDERQMHIFYKNNEIAGYAAIMHAFQIMGIDGYYGPRRKIVILGYGSVSRGAIYGLHSRGCNNLHVFTRRPAYLVDVQNPDVYHGHYFTNSDGILSIVTSENTERRLIDELATADIICNGILQDTDNPVMFVREHEIERLKPRSLIIDVSCDQGMGFSFAKPTTFEEPSFIVQNGITYYSVDHTPSYMWNAASREISRALLPHLEFIASGPETWQTNKTISRAIEIQEGIIKNRKILSFQNRESEPPYRIKR